MCVICIDGVVIALVKFVHFPLVAKLKCSDKIVPISAPQLGYHNTVFKLDKLRDAKVIVKARRELGAITTHIWAIVD